MHTNEVDRARLHIMYHLPFTHLSDLPAIMVERMVSALGLLKRASLPFPGLITEFARQAGVLMTNQIWGKPRWNSPIDRTIVRNTLKATREPQGPDVATGSDLEREERTKQRAAAEGTDKENEDEGPAMDQRLTSLKMVVA